MLPHNFMIYTYLLLRSHVWDRIIVLRLYFCIKFAEDLFSIPSQSCRDQSSFGISMILDCMMTRSWIGAKHPIIQYHTYSCVPNMIISNLSHVKLQNDLIELHCFWLYILLIRHTLRQHFRVKRSVQFLLSPAQEENC